MDTVKFYLGIIRRWWIFILLGTTLGAVGAYYYSLQQVPMYRSTALVVVDQLENPVITRYQDVQMNETLTDTYAQRLTSRAVLQAVASDLDLGTGLGGRITANPILNTSLIRVTVTDSDPGRAAAIANHIPEVFNRHDESVQQARFAELRARYTDQLDAIGGDIANVQEEIRQLTGSDAPGAQDQLEELQANLQGYRSHYQRLLDNYGELRSAEGAMQSTLILDDPAAVARVPFSPNIQRNTILGGIGGFAVVFLIGTGLSYLSAPIRERYDVTHSEDAETPYADPQVFSRNGKSQPAPAITMPGGASGPQIAQFLVQEVVRGDYGAPPTFLVASPTGQSNAYRVTADTAKALALAGQSTVVIDFDLDQRMIEDYYEVQQSSSTGQAASLLPPRRRAQLSGLIRSTAYANLRVVPAAEASKGDILDVKDLRAFIDRIRPSADIVLVKSPGVLDGSLSTVLVQQTDGALLVANGTGKGLLDIRAAVNRLEYVGGRVLTIILANRSTSSVETPEFASPSS